MSFYQRNDYNAIYRGVVENNEDPLNIGRCKIRIPSIHGKLNNPDILPWSRPVASSTINENRGTVNIPDIGDVVWVVFEGGNLHYPVYLGGMYSNRDIQVDKNKVVVYIEEGNAIIYDRENKYYTINIGESILTIKEGSISASIGDTSMNLSSSGVVINGDLKVTGNISTDSSLYVSGDYPCRAD